MSDTNLFWVPAEEDELDCLSVFAGELSAVGAGEGEDVLVEGGQGVRVHGEDADVREAQRRTGRHREDVGQGSLFEELLLLQWRVSFRSRVQCC